MPVRWSLVGAAALVAVLVLSAPVTSEASFPGRNGDLVLFTQLGFSSSLHFVTPGGRVRRTIDAFMFPGAFRASPNGRRLTFQVEDGAWVANVYGVHRRRILRGAQQPTWGPDGRHLAYVRDGSVWTVGLDGRGARRVTSPWGGRPSGWGSRDSDPSWSPDGRAIAFVRHRLAGARCAARTDLFVVNVRTRRTRLLLRPALRCPTVRLPDWSPDGRRLVVSVGQNPALHENTDPRGLALEGITVLRADGTHVRRIRKQFAAAVWSPDGHHLAYGALHVLSPSGHPDRTIATFRASSTSDPVWLAHR